MYLYRSTQMTATSWSSAGVVSGDGTTISATEARLEGLTRRRLVVHK